MSVAVTQQTRQIDPADWLPLARSVALAFARKLPRFVSLDDLEQAACIGLIEAARKWAAQGGASFRTYVERLMRLRLADHVRGQYPAGVRRTKDPAVADRYRASARLDDLADEPASGDTGSRDLAEARDLVDVALRVLPPRQRAAMEARYLRGLEVGAVASMLGVTPNGFYWMQRQALSLMRERLQRELAR